jgi:activator of HSP90 ATPase
MTSRFNFKNVARGRHETSGSEGSRPRGFAGYQPAGTARLHPINSTAQELYSTYLVHSTLKVWSVDRKMDAMKGPQGQPPAVQASRAVSR